MIVTTHYGRSATERVSASLLTWRRAARALATSPTPHKGLAAFFVRFFTTPTRTIEAIRKRSIKRERCAYYQVKRDTRALAATINARPYAFAPIVK